MPSFYFQIKGLDYNEDAYSKWAWPPLFSGRVEAESRERARAMIQAMYGEKFPGRVKKDDNSKPFLLHVVEIAGRDAAYLNSLFDVQVCQRCGREFRRIDLYNDMHEPYKGTEFCSQVCKDAARAEDIVPGKDDLSGSAIPCIYRITNRPTGRVYIGKTTQAFTLRWWQHVKWGTSDCKFHQALRESSLTDWTFEVVEVCESAAELNAREAHWIQKHDAIAAGYNSASAASQ